MSTRIPGLFLGVLWTLPVSAADPVRVDPPEPGDCPVVETVFDIDVPYVTARGHFTVNGQDPLPWASQTATIELRSDTLGVVELGQVHEGAYQKLVVPGVYDVIYKHEAGTLIPQNSQSLLLADVEIDGSIIDFDIPSLLVTGDITLNGGDFPNSNYERGEIRFSDSANGQDFHAGASDDGDYSLLVMPGTYDVTWSKWQSTGIVPFNEEATLVADVEIVQATDLDVDVRAITVNGVFELNGATPPASSYENGRVYVRDPMTGDMVELGETRDGSWSARLVPGTYEVVYSNMLGGSIVPANNYAVLSTSFRVTDGRSMTIDIPAVALEGAFTLDGGPAPASAYERGKVWLRGQGAWDLFELGTTDEPYSVRVVPGTYDAYYDVMLANTMMPENPWAVLVEDHLVFGLKSGATTWNIDVPTEEIKTQATIWGEGAPASIYENGLIYAVDAAGYSTEVQETRDGKGSVRVVAGDYELHFSHLIGDTYVPVNGDALIADDSLFSIVEYEQVNLEPGLISGVFSQNGAAFPAVADHHGELYLRDVVTGDVIPVGDTAVGQYDFLLQPGTYEVLYDHVEGNVVANQAATVGCVTFEPLPMW